MTRPTSLAISMALALTFPSALFLLHRSRALRDYRWVLLGSCLLALLIIWRHKGNIARILKGEEPRVGRREDLPGRDRRS